MQTEEFWRDDGRVFRGAHIIRYRVTQLAECSHAKIISSWS